MRKTIAATTTALALVLVGPAIAGGSFTVKDSLSIGASGSSLSKGGTSGGTYAKGKNGSNAFGFSENFVTNTGKAMTGFQCDSCGNVVATDTRTSKGWGKSKARTNGAGSIAEAFSERNTFGKSKTNFHAGFSAESEYNGNGGTFPGIGWGVGGNPLTGTPGNFPGNE